MSRITQVRKAARAQLKARVALDGPTGSGKTYTAIEWATALQGDGRSVVVDTEGGSAEWYSDRWNYDVLRWEPPYNPTELAGTIADAQYNYAVVVVDSGSHFWEGEGGTLDIVDAAAQRARGNSFAGWKVGTPALRHLVDTILHADCHVIVTMRSKMEYVLTEGKDGKQRPEKIGMAPIMRSGIEYEFTLIGDLDLEHRLTITKSRCSALADEVFQPGRASEAARQFLGWLNDGEPRADRETVDGLIERMNALPEAHRAPAKQEFVATFGRPEQLRESQVLDAGDLVIGWEEKPPPDDTSESNIPEDDPRRPY